MQRPDKAFLIAFWEEDREHIEYKEIRARCYALHGFTILPTCNEYLGCERRINKLTMKYYEDFDMVTEETFDAGYTVLREALDSGRSFPQHSILVPWADYKTNIQDLMTQAQKTTETDRRLRSLWIQAMSMLWAFIGQDLMAKQLLEG